MCYSVFFPCQSVFQPFARKFNAQTAEKHIMLFAAFVYITTLTPHLNALAAVFIAAFALPMLIMLTSRAVIATGSYEQDDFR